MTRALMAAICGLVLTVSPAATQEQVTRKIDPATAAAARRLLTVTGAAKLALSSMETMINAQRDSNPQIPEGFWDAFIAHASMVAGQTWGEAMGRIVGDSIARATENLPPQ